MNQGFSPRWIDLLLGSWLFVSAFIWEHTAAHFNNSWIVGLAVAIVAAVAMRRESLRYINAGLAVWLLLSSWVLPLAADATFWNNLVVSVLMFIVALTPRVERPRTFRPGPQAPVSVGARR